jgi:hypothetical protein
MLFLTKLFLHFFPKQFFRAAAAKQGIDERKTDLSYELFGDCERIDIRRVASGHRGFILTLDNKMELFFYQDGDHFTYDGFEIGEYEPGDVTALDHAKDNF